MKQTTENITEREKKAIAKSAELDTLWRVQGRIMDEIQKRAIYLYEPTAEYLYHQMNGERFQRTYRRRRDLFQRNNEDFRIIHLIAEMINETYEKYRDEE